MAHVLPLYVRVTRTQEVFGFSRATAYRLAARGKFRIYPRGNLAFLKVEEVVAYIEGNAIVSQPDAAMGGKLGGRAA